MKCAEVAEFLSDYVDHSLAFRQRVAFMFHLCLCRDCRHYLDSFRKTRSLIGIVSADDVRTEDEVIPEQLIQAILSAQGRLRDGQE